VVEMNAKRFRRGYFFTLDAFIAMGILMVGLAIVLSAHSYRPVIVQSNVIAGDILLTLSNLKVTEVNNPYVRTLLQNGTISNRDNSLLSQAGEFYVNNQQSMGFQFVNQTTLNVIPTQYNVNISINKTTVFFKGNQPKSNKVLVSSKTLVFGVYNNTFWGPYPAEVRVWE
jgi:hypothetical protein